MTGLLDEIQQILAHPIISGNWIIRPANRGSSEIVSTSYGLQRVMEPVCTAPESYAKAVAQSVSMLKEAYKALRNTQKALTELKAELEGVTSPGCNGCTTDDYPHKYNCSKQTCLDIVNECLSIK